MTYDELRPEDRRLALDPLAIAGDAALLDERWDHALACFAVALDVARALKDEDAESRARVGIIDARVGAAAEAEDWEYVVELTRAKVDAAGSDEVRVDALFALARTLGSRMGDLAGAIAELERARALDPSRDEVLEALRRGYRVKENWPKVFELTGALADAAPSALERAARRLVQAKIAIDQLKDGAKALPLLRLALEDDPTHDEALDLLCEIQTARGELASLEEALATLIDRFEALGDEERAWEARRRLLALPRPDDTARLVLVNDPDPEDALPIDPADAESRARLVSDLIARGEDEAASAELEGLAAQAPAHAPTHARLFAIHLRAGNVDRAYFSALALEELGEIGPEHRRILDERRPEGLGVRATLDASAWGLLRAPGADDVIESLLSAIAPAAIASHAGRRATRKMVAALESSRRLAPTSTASIVRTFHWAARALGVECPALYVLDEVPGDLAAVAAAEGTSASAPPTVIGPRVLSGLSTKDLAFLAGRHLTYYRAEHALLVHFPTVQELTALVLAAVKIAMPAMEVPASVAPAIGALAARLARHLGDAERERVVDAVKKLDARGGRIGLPTWIRSVELTAGRAGLLLSGDLRAAMARMRTEERAIASLTLEDRRADLLAFCASPALAGLRERVSIIPPPPPSPSRLSSLPSH